MKKVKKLNVLGLAAVAAVLSFCRPAVCALGAETQVDLCDGSYSGQVLLSGNMGVVSKKKPFTDCDKEGYYALQDKNKNLGRITYSVDNVESVTVRAYTSVATFASIRQGDEWIRGYKDNLGSMIYRLRYNLDQGHLMVHRQGQTYALLMEGKFRQRFVLNNSLPFEQAPYYGINIETSRDGTQFSRADSDFSVQPVKASTYIEEHCAAIPPQSSAIRISVTYAPTLQTMEGPSIQSSENPLRIFQVSFKLKSEQTPPDSSAPEPPPPESSSSESSSAPEPSESSSSSSAPSGPPPIQLTPQTSHKASSSRSEKTTPSEKPPAASPEREPTAPVPAATGSRREQASSLEEAAAEPPAQLDRRTVGQSEQPDLISHGPDLISHGEEEEVKSSAPSEAFQSEEAAGHVEDSAGVTGETILVVSYSILVLGGGLALALRILYKKRLEKAHPPSSEDKNE